METYKQEVKAKARETIWEHTISSLTINRQDIRIQNSEYMNHLWAYSKNRLKILGLNDTEDEIFNDWMEFSDITYGTKHPSQLKVAFFCGPEPENDVKILLEKGIRLENIYAFEYDHKIFEFAVGKLHETYPTLKIFNGKIEDFAELHSVTFDIVYLDFTRSLLKEYKTVFRLIDNNCLTDLSQLVVNTTIPEKTKENIDFLANYFFYTPMFEAGILHEDDEESLDNEDENEQLAEGCIAYGIYCPDEFATYIDRNFETAYSAFQTHFIIAYANLLKPIYALINKDFLIKRIFDINQMKISFENNEDVNKWECNHYCDGITGFHQLIESIFGDEPFFSEKDKGCKYSRNQACRLLDFYETSQYESFQSILSDVLKVSISKINKNIFGAKCSLFCDVPMIHLWLELIINQFGSPYHFNMKNHRRYKYKAKERDMYFDIFTFDKCRAFYDGLPMIEYYGADLSQLERQILTRMGMDAINKHSIYYLYQQYWASALVGINEEEWSINYSVPIRKTLL